MPAKDGTTKESRPAGHHGIHKRRHDNETRQAEHHETEHHEARERQHDKESPAG